MPVLYSHLKYFRFTDRLETLAQGGVVAPVHVRIKPINHCNHDCWYCAYRADGLTLGEGMNVADAIAPAKMDEIIGDLIGMGVKAVTFSGGGEPLLYKPLPDAIERLATGGVRVGALSNGSNLQGRVAEAFARHATWLRISVDAWDDASYVAARKVRHGDFTRLLDNIGAFAARGSRCTLGISFIVGHDNASHIAEAAALFKAAGVDHMKVTGVVVGDDATANNRYHAAIKAEVARQIEQARTLADESFTILDHYHELETLFDKTYTSCPSLRFLTVIGADGMVYACQDKAYIAGGALGSIKDRSFREFWFSEENRRRLHGIDPSVECRHHCIAHFKNLMLLEYASIDPDHGCFV